MGEATGGRRRAPERGRAGAGPWRDRLHGKAFDAAVYGTIINPARERTDSGEESPTARGQALNKLLLYSPVVATGIAVWET